MRNLWIVFAILTTNTGIAYQAVLVTSDRKPSVHTSLVTDEPPCQSLVTGESCQAPAPHEVPKHLYTMLNTALGY
jgi:hypothetical protein